MSSINDHDVNSASLSGTPVKPLIQLPKIAEPESLSPSSTSSLEATWRQLPVSKPDSVETKESCLVQIYPADMIDGMLLLERDTIGIGRSPDSELPLIDSSVSRQHAELVRRGQDYFLRDLGSTNGTLVNGELVTEEVKLSAGDTIRFGSFLFKYLSAGSVETQYHETVYSALTRDALTGTMNKRYLLESLTRETARCLRSETPMSVVMLDIDHFKSVNDQYGHLVGDTVLREFGGRVGKVCREYDLLARYGGEEFCLLLAATGRDEAMVVTERCRKTVSDTPFSTEAGMLSITASFGIATFNSAGPRTTGDLIEAADQKLYEAKRSGRNRVCV